MTTEAMNSEVRDLKMLVTHWREQAEQARAQLYDRTDDRLRWRVIADEPPSPDTDCLLMWGDGTVGRNNLPQHGTEDATWWRPASPPPRQEDFFNNECTAREALVPCAHGDAP